MVHLSSPLLSLQPALLSDLETLTRIQHEAITPASPIDRVIHPRGATETIVAAATATKKRGFDRPEVHYRKIVTKVDGEDGVGSQIVAFARWYVWAEGRNDNAWTKPYTYQPDKSLAPGDINSTVAAYYYEKTDAMKKKHIQDKPHLYISLLATRPAWQGKGCGRMLINEAMSAAQQHGLDDVFLISVAASRSFYEQYGFETVDTLSLNLSTLDGRDDSQNEDWVDTYLMRATLSGNVNSCNT